MNLALFVLLPGLLQRIIGWLYYRKRDPLDFEKYYSGIMLFWYASYGGWTIYNIALYFNLPEGCTETMLVSMLSYEICMFVGIMPASACIICLLLALVILPLMVYQWHNKRLARTAHARATKELFKWLIEDSYNPLKMGSTSECSICLDVYVEG